MTGKELLEFLEGLTAEELAMEVKVGYDYGDISHTHATGYIRGVGVTHEVEDAYSRDDTAVNMEETDELDELEGDLVIVVSCHPDGARLG